MPCGSFFQRLFGGSAGRAGFTCYLRENGPIAYELDLFGSAPRDRADAMMIGRARPGPGRAAPANGPTSPASRCPLSWPTCRPACCWSPSKGTCPTEVTDAEVADWIRRFCRIQPVPLAAVINVDARPPGPVRPAARHRAVNRLLDAWGLDKGAAERKSYARLGPSSLEAHRRQPSKELEIEVPGSRFAVRILNSEFFNSEFQSATR